MIADDKDILNRMRTPGRPGGNEIEGGDFLITRTFVNLANTVSLENMLSSKKVRQVASLYVSMVLGIIVGIGVSVANTRLLTPQQFGEFRFLTNLFSFVMPFMTVGIFYSASRLLAQNRHEGIRHQLTGSLMFLTAMISLLLIAGFFCFSFFENIIFKNNLGSIIRLVAPLLFVFPFQLCIENILPSSNRIYTLSIFRLGAPTLYLATILALQYFVPLDVTSAISVQLLTLFVILLSVVILLKPDFTNLRQNVYRIWQENKAYGFHVYVGAITGAVSGDIGGLAIAYFVDTTHVGFYSLALTTAMPLGLIPSVVGTTFFKDFANMDRIPRKVVLSTVAISLFTVFIFLIVIKQLIIVLYSPAYLPSVPLTYILALATTCHGFGDFINRFLAAHGRGKEMRNSNFAICITNLLGFTVLVHAFGITGAAVTRFFGSLMYLSMMVYFYRSYRKVLIQRA